MAALGVVPASRVAMDTSSLLIAFGPPLTFKTPAPKLIISDEFNRIIIMVLERFRVTLTANGKCSDFKLRISDQNSKKTIKTA